jgi:hypothetical protein
MFLNIHANPTKIRSQKRSKFPKFALNQQSRREISTVDPMKSPRITDFALTHTVGERRGVEALVAGRALRHDDRRVAVVVG